MEVVALHEASPQLGFLSFGKKDGALNMDKLAAMIEAKSGRPPVVCDADELRAQLGNDVAALRERGYDPSIIERHAALSRHLEPFLTHPQFGRYLRALTPTEGYVASGVRVLSLDAIRQEVYELAPGAYLFPHGYMPFASSFGGDAICFHPPTGRVVWADHETFGSDAITHTDRELPFTPENIALAAVTLAEDFDSFLAELLQDRLTARLDHLG